MQRKLNCAHALHILWPCKSSVVVWLPAERHAKNTHVTANVHYFYMMLSGRSYRVMGFLCHSFAKSFNTYTSYSSWMSALAIAHVAVLDELFEVFGLACIPAFLISTCTEL